MPETDTDITAPSGAGPHGTVRGKTGAGKTFFDEARAQLLTPATVWPGKHLECPECSVPVIPSRDQTGQWVYPGHRDCPASRQRVRDTGDALVVTENHQGTAQVDAQVAAESGGDMRTCRPDKPAP